MVLSNKWTKEVAALSKILLESGLTATTKWGQPCYTLDGKNIAIVHGFKDYSAVSFFKGALMKDPQGLLVAPGENSQSARQIRFTSQQDIMAMRDTLKAFVQQAIEIEKSGQKIEKKPQKITLPDELNAIFSSRVDVKTAFESLTPDRQRAYLLFFTAAKQSATRDARIQKYIPRILDGKGMHDCVCGLSKKMPGCDGSHKETYSHTDDSCM